jgi:carboxyl-terminal processing protease
LLKSKSNATKNTFMRKLILFLSLSLLLTASAKAQGPSLQQKLYYTCKVWGFVKYYHSEVSTCHTDWDSVLLHVLPLVRAAASDSEFNDALDTMLAAAGSMAIATSYFPDTLNYQLKRNRDWGWISSSVFRPDVRTQLDTIKNNFRPHPNCYVGYNTSGGGLSGNWGGYLKFPQDTTMLHVTMSGSSYPSADNRQLLFFKLWNIVRYFNPYNYALSNPWDSSLAHFVLPFDNALSASDFNLTYLRLTSKLEDAHVDGLSYMYYPQATPPGYYQPRIRLKYVEGQYVVIKSAEPGILPGDAIISVDGLTAIQWEDSLKQYYSAGSIPITRRLVAASLLGRPNIGQYMTLVVADSTNTTHTFNVMTINSFSSSVSDFYYNDYYPADSLNSIDWTILGCNVGYMNFGNITDGGTDSAYDAMHTLPAIIIDIRNYPMSGTAWALSDKMLTAPTEFAKLTIPNVTYPGTYSWDHGLMGHYGNPTPYFGRVVVIVDETTQSAAEYTTMMLKKVPGTIVVGSHTAGADGNITYLKPANDMRFGWTSLGVYYPNGDSTQMIGIVPDSAVVPTREGVRHNRDYVLEKAMQIAGCQLPNVIASAGPATIYIQPNPAQNELSVNAFGINSHIDITITDLTGKIITQKGVQPNGSNSVTSFDISNLASGMYLVNVKTDVKQFVFKLIKN